MDELVSQFHEGGANGSADLMPNDPAKQQERRRQVRVSMEKRCAGIAQRFRTKLADFYPPAKAAQIQHAEAFESCEYGRRPDKAELIKLFPFFED